MFARELAEMQRRDDLAPPVEMKIGDRLPMPPRKLDIRPAFTGAGGPSFKPARNGKK